MFLGGAVYLLAVTASLQEVSGYAADLCGPTVGIINGDKIPIEDAPYIAALNHVRPNSDLNFVCGSTIIHERFLLTAAHCALMKKDTTYASMGSERYLNTSTNTVIEVDKFILHEHYDFDKNKNDICLVKLKKPVPFRKNIAKIELAAKNSDVKPGSMVKVIGWGTNEHNELPLELLQTTVPVLSRKCCHETDKTVDDAEICAGVKGRGPCHGDSGGPLVYDNALVGIVSHVAKHIDPCGGGMDVYTRVNAYLDWINTNIANNL